MTTATQTVRRPGSISSPIAHVSPLQSIEAVAGDEEPIDKTSDFFDEPSVFDGGSICFSDKLQWQVQEPMSHIEPQRTNVPCEARQIFSAICLEEPHNKHPSGERAVIKIKFQ
jgi:hypothetical protein